MANSRQRRLMQQALDEQLAPEARDELRARLDVDFDTAAEFDRLQRADRLLRSAPFERAPKRLAMKIIARLAEDLQPRHLSRLSGFALALALSLLTAVMLPLLAGAGWLVISIIGSAAALAMALQQISNLLLALRGVLDVLVEQAQALLTTYPQMPFALLALLPAASLWFWLARHTRSHQAAQANVALLK